MFCARCKSGSSQVLRFRQCFHSRFMFTIHSPSRQRINEYLKAVRHEPYSYVPVGATQGTLPRGFTVDRYAVQLGSGQKTFRRARRAVELWKMFPEDFSRLCWPDAPIQQGTVVAVLFHTGPLWSLNPCRIVYILDQSSPTATCGFAYGTLPGHVECGEEQFKVTWCSADDSVWYEIVCFSRPQHPLAYLGYPYVRHQQRRFRELSGQVMLNAVSLSTDKVRAADCPS